MHPTQRRFTKRLRVLREARGMDQGDLAAKAGISRAYLWRIEDGRQDPRLATLIKLAKALRVTVGELLG